MDNVESDRNPVELLAAEFAMRLRAGQTATIADYCQRYPEYAAEIDDLFPVVLAIEGLKESTEEEEGEDALSETNDEAFDEADVSGVSLLLFGDYYITTEVGRGGMGVVYEAKQNSLARRVALKVLPANYLPSRKHVLRFQREAQSAARLHHTNIVPVFGVGEQDGTHYFVMQFIDGDSLDIVVRELRDLRFRDGSSDSEATGSKRRLSSACETARVLVTTPLKRSIKQERTSLTDSSINRLPYWENVARIGVQVADALDYAHAQGVLHRDVKPSNLMIDRDGAVWVTDFGLAKVAWEDDLTDSGDTVGTLRYMAPEQLAGRPDKRSDIYSLGLTLYELLVFQSAYNESDRTRLLQQLAHGTPARPRSINREIPRDLETIVLKAMAHHSSARYQSAGELANDLSRFLSGRPIQARKTSLTAQLWRWSQRNPAVARLSAAVCILILGIAVVATIGYVRTTRALEDADDARHNAQKAREQAEFEKTQAEQEAANAKQRIEVLEERIRQLKLDAAP